MEKNIQQPTCNASRGKHLETPELLLSSYGLSLLSSDDRRLLADVTDDESSLKRNNSSI